MSNRLSIAIALGLASASAGVPSAGEVLRFSDGRELVVESWTVDGEWARIRLPGGGRMALPAAGVVGSSDLPDPEPTRPAETVRSPIGDADGWRNWAGEFAPFVDEAAARHAVEPVLLTAMMRIESNFDPFAVSPKGACGLLQLIPATAERFGVRDVFDPRDNIHGGARYLGWLLDRFQGDRRLALAAYNAGENAVTRYGGIPPYRETRDYVEKVLGMVERYSASAPGARIASAR